MDENIEIPNWLNELEAKREKRLKARLGHEAGAGALCLTCKSKCPGLDLHFWRKICKNCKCSKENHDVHDDDLYGWTQFQLFGSRPNKIKKKIKLPGENNEVELDWTPNGHLEIVENYLKALPTDQLPVKGSQAAKNRKQLLQKQIPIHDIDPTLCHELSENELKKMNDYIEKIKTYSVGIGHVIQMGMMAQLPINSSILTNRYPKEVSSIETVSLQAENLASNIIKIDNLNLNNDNLLNHYAVGKMNIINDNQTSKKVNNTIKNLIYDQKQPLKSLNPSNYPINELNLSPNSVNIGIIKDINYATVTSVKNNEDNNSIDPIDPIIDDDNNPLLLIKCHRCNNNLNYGEFGIKIDRIQAYFHSNCFKCNGCNQNLADMVYFYDKESDDIYCGRDYAKIRGIPRCQACDELIFVKEYCLADNSTYHIKHFCCFQCDKPLAGQNYIIDDDDNNLQPLCLPCYEKIKAENCNYCNNIIKPNEQGVNLNNLHYHANDNCFVCDNCNQPLLKRKYLFKNFKLYCSYECYKIFK